MREGENLTQTPGKSTSLFHCRLALKVRTSLEQNLGTQFRWLYILRIYY